MKVNRLLTSNRSGESNPRRGGSHRRTMEGTPVYPLVLDCTSKMLRCLAFTVMAAMLILLVNTQLAVASDGPSIEELISMAEAERDDGDYADAGTLYEQSGSLCVEEGDWEEGAAHYVSSAQCFSEAERYEDAANSYSLAGDCYYDEEEFDDAMDYYQAAAAAARQHKELNPDYGVSWIEEKIEECESEKREERTLTLLIAIAVMLGLVKFSSKAGLGSAYSPLGRKGIILIAAIYLALGFLLGMVVGLIGANSVSENLKDIMRDHSIIFGLFQLGVSLLLGYFAFVTISKSRENKDVSGKTFLAMAVPCPTSIITMVMSAALLAVAGMPALVAGLFVGGIFFVSVVGISFLSRRLKPGQGPSTLGVIMLFFAMIYLLTIFFVPAYLEAAETDIKMDFPVVNMIPVFLSLAVIVGLGFVLDRMRMNESTSRAEEE